MDATPFREGAEIFRWGPIPGTVLYPSAFLPPVFLSVREEYPEVRWPRTLFLMYDRRMVWLNDLVELREAGRVAFLTYILPDASRAALWEKYRSLCVVLRESYERVRLARLESLSEKDLGTLWSSFHKTYDAFWVPTIPAELGNYGSHAYFDDVLSRVIPDAATRAAMTEILFSPEAMSFYQEEEVALAETETLAEHAKAFSWIHNSYASASLAPLSSFQTRKHTISPTIREEIEQKRKKVIAAKAQAADEYHLPAECVHIADVIVRAIELQDDRKKHIFMAIEAEYRLLQEVVRRFAIPLGDLLLLAWWEVESLLKGDDAPVRAIADRREWAGFLYSCDKQEALSADAVRRYWDLYAEEKVDAARASEVRGIVVSKGAGNVCGRARILLDPTRTHEFEQGDILLAPMTSPEYIFAMRKAAAVITDTGGLTSHAAIVSRELGIPCLVGTKVATKVFRDGDLIEVDITSGVARKV